MVVSNLSPGRNKKMAAFPKRQNENYEISLQSHKTKLENLKLKYLESQNTLDVIDAALNSKNLEFVIATFEELN